MKFFILFIVLVQVLLLGNMIVYRSSSESVNFVVNEKERIMDCSTNSEGVSSCNAKYLIFTENEVFENVDKFIIFKFDSSDQYAKMVNGTRCSATAYGWRVPFLSWYRNLDDVHCERH